MMESKLYKLLSILNAEYELLVGCLERLLLRQQTLTENNRGGLLKESQGELAFLSREAVDPETERVGIIEFITGRLKLRPGDNAVSGLPDFLRGADFRKFEGLKKTIIEAFERAESRKRRNDSLIRRSLDMIEKTMDCDSRTDDCRAHGRTDPESSENKEITGAAEEGL